MNAVAGTGNKPELQYTAEKHRWNSIIVSLPKPWRRSPSASKPTFRHFALAFDPS
jgi:hypothetical protein